MKGEDGRALCGRELTDLMPVTDMHEKITCSLCKKKYQVSVIGTQREITTLAGLSDRHIRFAAHPLVMTSAKKAALEAGFPKSTAHSHSGAMRKDLMPLIQKFQEERARRFSIAKEDIQGELRAMGFANIADYIHNDPVSGRVRPKRMDELTREQAAAIKECSFMEWSEIKDDKGNYIDPIYVLAEIKLFDKRASLVDLGKTIGMFNDKLQLQLPGTPDNERADVPLSSMSNEVLEKVHLVLKQALSTVGDAQADQRSLPGEFTTVSGGKKSGKQKK